ncbi:MAG TPA: hypothetical protein HPP94_07165 [Desulfuromonadales bacterium]|nr:hypothetical protein [Desulfuromonadales bacterium]
MRYINEVDGLKVVMSLRDLNELVDELRVLTMPPVLAGLERLNAPAWFIARQLAVPEQTLSHWQTGLVYLTADRQSNLCKLLEQAIGMYEKILADDQNDNNKRPFYEIGVLQEHIRCARKLLNMQRDLLEAGKPKLVKPDFEESELSECDLEADEHSDIN